MGVIGLPLTVLAKPHAVQPATSSHEEYEVYLDQLNNSGVSGTANLKFKPGSGVGDERLKVSLNANGTTPDKTHAIHIHGASNPEVAMCPTPAVDKNRDGFISVVEGAATYGPIKINLTSPQTPFGASPSPALFTPFAGTPDSKNFPVANASGDIGLRQTYKFDSSVAARQALQSITPLENQHIVVHGDFAPASVDADAFEALGAPITGSKDAVIYDTLLPVACGEIQKTVMQNEPGDETPAPVKPPVDSVPTTNAVSGFQARIETLEQNYTATSRAALARFEASSSNKTAESRDQFIAATQSARDHYINQFYEARNKFVDQLNQSGDTAIRDSVSAQAEKDLDDFSKAFEASRKAFLESTANQQ